MDFRRMIAAAVLPIMAAGCGNRDIEFDACGQIDATDVTVSAESSGRILSLGIEEGDKIVAGQLLGAIDSVQIWLQKKELQERKEGARSRIVDIGKQIAPSVSQLENLKKDHGRFVSLLSKDAGTRKQLDDNESQIAVLEGQIAAQKQTYEQNNDATMSEIGMYDVQIAQREDQLRKCRITAPVSGTVLTKYAEAGEFTSAGKPLFKVADLDRVYLRAYVTSARLSEIRLGQQVRVFSDYGSGHVREYPGTVTWISDRSEFTPKNIQTADERKNLVYAVKVAVDNDGLVKLGMYGGIIF